MGGSNWPTTSVRLVAALRRPEDHAAWERFSEEYGPALSEYGKRHGLQQADAEDIVQIVFLGVYGRVSFLEYSADRGRFRSWLSTIALRAIWKLQKRRLAQGCELKDPDELTGLQAAQTQLVDEINESVLQLAVDEVRPEFAAETWEAFSSIWFEGERPQAVAARLGRSASWVYKAKFNVLQRLKCVVQRVAHDLDEF